MLVVEGGRDRNKRGPRRVSDPDALPSTPRLLIALALAVTAALPAAARRVPRQPVAFEAPRELLD